MVSSLRGRRAEYAQATRDAIRSAARELFVTKGYFATRVDEIAEAARVSQATVYAVGGGKHGLLRDLIAQGAEDPQIIAINAAIEAATDPRELVGLLVDARSLRFDQWSGLMRQVIAAAPQEAAVQDSLDLANTAIRGGLARTAQRLADMRALRTGMSVDQATDILWYYLNNGSYFTLTDELGWPLTRATAWILQQLLTTLLM